MKEFYIIMTKDIKDIHYSTKKDKEGNFFKRYVYKNVSEEKGSLNDYISIDYTFHIEKLLMYQEKFDTLEDFIEKEREIMKERLKEKEFEKQFNNLIKAIEYAKDNNIISYISKKNKELDYDLLERTYIRTSINGIGFDNVKLLSTINNLFVEEVIGIKNNELIKRKIPVFSKEEYIFFLVMKEKNLYEALLMYDYLLNYYNYFVDITEEEQEDLCQKLFFKFLIKHHDRYNLYQKV